MTENSLVWYLSYGSNILAERFHCYIAGGQPLGSQRTYEGCRDTSAPRGDKPTIINRELYFSKNSPVWDNGGVGFINVHPDKTKLTLARMYLITEEQLADVAKQETNSNNYLNINLRQAVENGNTIFKSPSWYGKLLYLGEDSEAPIFALTNEIDLQEYTRPSASYLITIIRGIKQSHGLLHADIVNYLMSKKGLCENYSAEALASLIDQNKI